MNITREPFGLLYMCHRASCQEHGIRGAVFASAGSTKAFEPRFFRGETTEVPSDIFNSTFGKYGLHPSHTAVQGVKYIPAMQRVLLPLYDYRGAQVGEILKTVAGGQPKVLTNRHNDVPNLYFPLGYNNINNELVLVEDWISALCIHVKCQVAVACTSGTHLTSKGVSLIKSLNLKVKLFFDGDMAGATGAASLAIKYGGDIPIEIRLPPWGYDPKDMTQEALKMALE